MNAGLNLGFPPPIGERVPPALGEAGRVVNWSILT